MISAIAEAHGVTSAQVILRWNLQRGVVVIPGSSNPDHIRENLTLFGFELTDEEMMTGIDLSGGRNGKAPVVKLSSGCDLPVVGLGTYALHGSSCVNAVRTALESGYRLIDTASFYGNEWEVGEGVRASGV